MTEQTTSTDTDARKTWETPVSVPFTLLDAENTSASPDQDVVGSTFAS